MFPGYAGFRFTLAAEQSFCQARPFCHYRGQLLVLRCSVALFWSLIQTWYFNLKDIWNILYLLWMNEIVVQTPFFFFFLSNSSLPFWWSISLSSRLPQQPRITTTVYVAEPFQESCTMFHKLIKYATLLPSAESLTLNIWKAEYSPKPKYQWYWSQ